MIPRFARAARAYVPRLVLEIGAGVLIGPSVMNAVQPSDGLHHVADAAAAVLLFLVGMHVDTAAMRRVGRTSMNVALIGVVAPVVVGFAAGLALGESMRTSLFLGAALAATSIGITARVFRDAGRLDSVTARIVIGAAVIDDVLGLLLLVIVSAVAGTNGVDAGVIGASILIVGSFFLGAVVARSPRAASIEQTVSRIAPVIVPLFFIHIGIKADAAKFVSPPVLGIASIVFVVAMGTKLLAGFGSMRDDTDRVTIGLAMAPRGEVGLIFAATAVSAGAFDDRMYAVVLLVVLATTVVTPVLLRRRLAGS